MEFLDNSGHIFVLKSHDIKPIGHEYDENDYIFWLDSDNENFLSVDNYYMRSINMLVDLNKRGVQAKRGNVDWDKVSVDDLIDIKIELNSSKYCLIGSAYVQEELSKNSSINDIVDISDDSEKKQILENDDLMLIKTTGSYNNTHIPYLLIPFYVVGRSSEEGTWLSNILISVTDKSDDSTEYCSITVGGEYKDNYEELMINAQNMGVRLPKNIIKSIYSVSYHNNEFNEVVFNQKIKEYMMNYMNIRGEVGNFRSVLDSLEWFGWGKKIELSRLLKTDNQFKMQYFLDYFNINVDVLESFQFFKNTSYMSLKVKLNNETGEYHKKIIDKESKASYFEGEENRVLESLTDKQIPVEAGFDNEKYIYMKQYYDYSMNELGLKLSCLKHYYQKYFLPIHVKIHSAYLAHKVYANDLKMTTFPKIEMATENIYLPELSRGNSLAVDNEVEFLGKGIHYFVKQYDFFIDDQYNEFNGFLENAHKDYYYLNDTCVNIPIKFKNKNKQYSCVLVLEKEIENNGSYCHTYDIEKPFNYYEVFAYVTKSGDVIEYKDVLMAYREFPCASYEDYSLYFSNGDLYDKVSKELSKTIEVTSKNYEGDELDEDHGYNLRETFIHNSEGDIIGSKYAFEYCGQTVYVDPDKETFQNIYIGEQKYVILIPASDKVDVNLFFGNEMTFTCSRISQFNIKFKTVDDNISKVIKFSEAGLYVIDHLKLLPENVRILKYEDRRRHIISHYEEYKWVELINSTYISEEDIFDIVYNNSSENVSYKDFINAKVLSSTLDKYRKKNLRTADILNKLFSMEKFGDKGEYAGCLYEKDVIGKPVWNKDITQLLIEKTSYEIDFTYKTSVPSELVYESHFTFAQTDDHYYKNFIICPRIMKQADIRYWQNSNFRLSLLVNNKWYEYRFSTHMPEPNVQLGRLKYNYWKTDENYYSPFTQIKHIDKIDRDGIAGEVIFNNFMYEPSLVTVNNVNYYDDLLDYNKSQHIVNYNSEQIDVFNDCKDFIVYENGDFKCIIYISKNVLKNNDEIHAPKIKTEDEFSKFKEIVIYRYSKGVNGADILHYFVKYDDFDTFEYKTLIVTEDSCIDVLKIDGVQYRCSDSSGNIYHIKEVLRNKHTLRDRYKIDLNIPSVNKYLNSVCLFNLYKKIKIERNLLNFRGIVNLSVNGILFVKDGSSERFFISGKQIWNKDMNTGEVADDDDNVYIEGSVDMYHDRWYDFEKNEWKPKINKRYVYYLGRDESTGEQYVTNKPSEDLSKTIEFYQFLTDDIKGFQNFVHKHLNEHIDEDTSYMIFVVNEGGEPVYYVTSDNKNTKYRLMYKMEFVMKDAKGEYTVKDIDENESLKYISNKYYIESNGELTHIKMRITLYYKEEKTTSNIPVFVDAENEKKYLMYLIENNILVDNSLVEWVDENTVRIFTSDYEDYADYEFVSSEGRRRLFKNTEDDVMLVVVSRLVKTVDEFGNDVYIYYDENDCEIELSTYDEMIYVDYQGNPIGTQNPINWWVELEEISVTEDNDITWDKIETDLNVVAYYKDSHEVTDDDMYQIAQILRSNEYLLNGKTDVDKNSDKDDALRNRFDYLETEDVPELTEYFYNKDIYLQQNVKDLAADEYTFTWKDAYTENTAEDMSWAKRIHDSIQLVAVVRHFEDGRPAAYDGERETHDPTETYLIYNKPDTTIVLKEGEFITLFFTIKTGCEDMYDGFWLTPYLFSTTETFVPMTYEKYVNAEEDEISFELDGKRYSYGTNQTSEIVDLYSRFFKEKYIVYRNRESDSITKILERDISSTRTESDRAHQKYNIETTDFEELTESEQIDEILKNPLAKYVIKYEQQISLGEGTDSDNDSRFQLDYDLYLMHDDEQWYCMFISRQTLDKVDEFSNIYNLKHSDIYFTSENENGIMEFKLEFRGFENRFLLNRYINEIPKDMNAFNDDDIITAQLVNNDRLPVHLDISAKYRISSLSIGNLLQQEVDSNSEMAIINVPNNDSRYLQGFYKIDVDYSLDGFTQQSYKDTKKFKIYKT